MVGNICPQGWVNMIALFLGNLCVEREVSKIARGNLEGLGNRTNFAYMQNFTKFCDLLL